MSKSFISNPARFGVASWRLTQTLWVGGLCLLHFAVLPALLQIGLASLLVEEVSNHLKPFMVGLAVCGALWQWGVLVVLEGLGHGWRDRRGQLLLAVLALAGAYFALNHWLASAGWWLQFVYLLLAFCGTLLVMQPSPDGGASRARRARH